jgi:GTP-binding protein
VKKDPDKRKYLEYSLERHFKHLSYAPRIYISAKTGEKVRKIFDKIEITYDQFCERVPTGELNRTLKDILYRKPPPRTGRTRLKVFYATQTGIKPPTFVLFVNNPKIVHFSYQRFLVNQIRMHFHLDSTPIRLFFRERGTDGR